MSEAKIDYKKFYENVKKWTVSDYFNPGIKAEVILDMLLTPYITKIVANYLNKEAKNIKLLAKEFPIDNTKDDFSLRNNKVDYLLEYGDEEKPKIYLVELKTTNSSFDVEQFENYIRIMNGNEKGVLKKENGIEELDTEYSLFRFYERIYEKYVESAIDNYIGGHFSIISGTGKYIFQIAKLLGAEDEFGLKNKLLENKGDLNIQNKKAVSQEIKKGLNKFIKIYEKGKGEIELIYISLQKELKKEIENLEKYEGNKKKIHIITLDIDKMNFSPVLQDFVEAINKVDPQKI